MSWSESPTCSHECFMTPTAKSSQFSLMLSWVWSLFMVATWLSGFIYVWRVCSTKLEWMYWVLCRERSPWLSMLCGMLRFDFIFFYSCHFLWFGSYCRYCCCLYPLFYIVGFFPQFCQDWKVLAKLYMKQVSKKELQSFIIILCSFITLQKSFTWLPQFHTCNSSRTITSLRIKSTKIKFSFWMSFKSWQQPIVSCYAIESREIKAL